MRRLAIVLLLLMLGLPALVNLYHYVDKGDGELTVEGISQWFEAHYVGKKRLAGVAANLRFAFGMEPTDGAVIGRDNYLFLTRHKVLEQARGADVLSASEMRALVSLLRQREGFWAERGVTWLNVIAPGKSSVYRHKLPRRYELVGVSRIAQINSALEDEGVSNVDLLRVMQRSAENDTQLYFKTDSHWTCYAAFLAYEAVMAALAERTGLSLAVVGRSQLAFRYAETFGDITTNVFGMGRTYGESGLHCEYPAVESVARDFASGHAVVARVPRGGLEQLQSVHFENEGALNSLRVAVLRDSYFWPVQPLLNATFSEVLYLYHWHLRPQDEHLLAFNPDIVIYEYTDRALHLPVQHLREQGSLILPPLHYEQIPRN